MAASGSDVDKRSVLFSLQCFSKKSVFNIKNNWEFFLTENTDFQFLLKNRILVMLGLHSHLATILWG